MPVGQVRRDLQALSARERARRVVWAERTLSDVGERKVLEKRLAAKILAASHQRGVDAVRRLLHRRDGRYAFEVHFSVLAFIGEAAPHLRSSRTSGDLMAVVSDYLRTVPSDTAYAAWMAGHALGGHFANPEARRMLLGLSASARYAAGRAAAVSGLCEAIREHGRGKEQYCRIFEGVAQRDRSKSVRTAASLAVWQLSQRRDGSAKALRSVT